MTTNRPINALAKKHLRALRIVANLTVTSTEQKMSTRDQNCPSNVHVAVRTHVVGPKAGNYLKKIFLSRIEFPSFRFSFEKKDLDLLPTNATIKTS